MHITSALITLLLFASTALAQTPVLVKDINPGTGSSFPLSKEIPVPIGPVIYFSANDGVHGEELWRSDGTAAGTYMVKDIWPDGMGSAPIRLTVLEDKILFFANDGVHGDELWVSDGTAAGTALVKDINPGAGNAIRRNYLPQERDRVIFNGAFFFAADTGPNFSQLWRSDGTEIGTLFVSNVCPSCNANNDATGEFAILNDTLFLEGGSKLWRSDGTTAGTVPFLENQDSGWPGTVRYLASANGLLYMSGGTNAFSLDLWASDGTKAGTRLVKDFTDAGTPHFFTAFAGRAFFFSNDRLWSTDGTEAGTQLESQLVAENPFQRKNNLFVWKNELYYRARAADNVSYVYKTDGGPNGETQVYVQDFAASSFNTPVSFAATDDFLFYDVNSVTPAIRGIVRVDSTGATTGFPVGNTVENLVVAGDNLFFWTQNNATGKELWKLPFTTSATKDRPQALSLRLYPTISPDGIYYLEVEGAAALEVRVFDAAGRAMLQFRGASVPKLDLSALPAGLYWVNVTADNGRFSVRKVIVGK